MTIDLKEYFELSSLPFPRAANDQALLTTAGLMQVSERLSFALTRDTIALLVAESGCGKSTALSRFAKSLDAASYYVLGISLTTLEPFSFIAHLLASTGLPGRRCKGETAIALLSHMRSQPQRTVVLIDEAHLLPDASLQDLRLLTADSFDRRSPFDLVLSGQPLLSERLAEPQHYALWQRIGVRLRLRPLSESELGPFLERHLEAAGCKSKGVFAQDAVAALFHHSRGIPRLVQNIALDAMLVAMMDGKQTVDAEAVQQAVADLEGV